jgi:hypothetical protein
MWKWMFRFSALPKRWISVTAPVWPVARVRPGAPGYGPPEVLQNFPNDQRVLDARDHSHLTAATFAAASFGDYGSLRLSLSIVCAVASVLGLTFLTGRTTGPGG